MPHIDSLRSDVCNGRDVVPQKVVIAEFRNKYLSMQSQFPDKTEDLDGEARFGEACFIAPRDGFLRRVPYTLGLTRVQQAEVQAVTNCRTLSKQLSPLLHAFNSVISVVYS